MPSAFITGTAGDIGAAAAIAFSRAGFAVTGYDRRPSTELDRAGLDGPVLLVEGDMESPASLASALERTCDEATLVHVVGVAGGALDEEVAAEAADRLATLEEFRASLERNLTLQYALVAAVTPYLEVAARAGATPSVTLVSSINALACYGLPAYSAAKAGIAGLVVALADRLGRDGIRINALALGTVPTRRLRELYPQSDFDRLRGLTSLGRLGSPEQIGDTLLAIASAMTHATGQVVVADGGQLIHRGGIAR
jgi:NAD(P)-dependent dehydrogenase (short-subunit alcohol dehydrogenase family)